MTAEPELDTLHRARIRGLVSREELGDVGPLVEAGLLAETPRGCLLTPAGLEHHDALLLQWRATIDLEALAKSYERFLKVNQPVKDACASWQSSARDDEALYLLIDGLTATIERARPALASSGEIVPRFATYAERLEQALQAAAAGDERFVTSPTVDSVHSIWFQCHEDYLTTLGRTREADGSY